MNEVSEKVLIGQLADNAEGAFECFVQQYQHMIFNTSLNFLAIKEDAEEITQDVFVEVYKSIGSFKGESTLKTWVYRIAITKCLEFLRKAKRKKRFAFMVSIGNIGENSDEPKTLDHPGVLAENHERTEILYRQINRLPDNQRIAFTLYNMDGISYKEISQTMDLSVSSVESLIFRAKKNLRKKLFNYYKKT